jgi:NAD-dependent DNA ligase
MPNKLNEFLNLASRSYYAGAPIISDEVFDRLAESAGYNQVGAKQHQNIVPHMFPMYSLQKYYEGEGKPIVLPGKDIDTSPKLDGAAVCLLYVQGHLVRAATRGDGNEGSDVTEKFVGSKLVPQQLTDVPDVLQVTGELCAPKHVENARNYASGALNLKDVNEFRTRSVEFFAYGVEPNLSNTFREDMQCLSKQGFCTVKDANLHEVFPLDGIVHRLNNHSEFYAAGYTSKHPKGAVAIKERDASVETKLLDVIWQTGRTGRVTPVAILEPVMVGDAQVSRATLNNMAFIEALDLRIGDTVGVVRAGQIIPQITHKVV